MTDIEIEEAPAFFSTEAEILHELNEVLPGFTSQGTLTIEFIDGRVPVLRWVGTALLSQLSERGRELLSAEIERHYTRGLVNPPVEDEACGTGQVLWL